MAEVQEAPQVFPGKVVHYIDSAGLLRPAIVTKVWHQESGCCNLYALPAQSGQDPYLVTSIPYSSEKKCHSWHEVDEGQPGKLVTAELLQQPAIEIVFSPTFYLNDRNVEALEKAAEAATKLLEPFMGLIKS